MTYNIGEKKDGKLIVEFKLNADEWEAEVQKAYERNKGKYKLDGFRQGKIPRKVLEKNYGEFLFYEDALSVACDNCFFEMLEKEKDIQAVDYPDISVKNVSKDGVEFVATITLLPEVTLGPCATRGFAESFVRWSDAPDYLFARLALSAKVCGMPHAFAVAISHR